MMCICVVEKYPLCLFVFYLTIFQ
uniref:Uncharacterized protein n=1 Tax=Arundo donax TaxID=35708 RepID=A0A0A9CJL7_ARUDO